MKVATTRFGELEIQEKDILFFPVAVPGFPEVRRYVMLDHDKEGPLKWLQAVDRVDLAFPIVPIDALVTDYRMTVSADDLATLGLPNSDELVTFVILTIPSGAPERTTANLKAPVIMNPRTHLARQVLTAEDYPIRYPLYEAQPAAVECAG